ncbi:Bug family tripartite tricarboxylate transporter substrate binding protein [Sabulicella glaciei]|uniref:Tripartite tricarboxylate transporter substrate binding protein n=1 Tax=Sabulicella glaciei TaxID=2984948 RepID=A0ABT3NRJ2_9PROT|nr:tripartite tricarboxylate transporter substrate binding protein [Roseococcus sp. MDT2-1-1]MCW8084473.1 tripartite tricarboxylate transporter substrate binding protein [Roseococcus sp. MDT2-1-1]
MIQRRLLLAAAPSLLAAPALAQSWPDRPIRLIVGFPAGSVTDSLARMIAEPLGRELGQPVVIDNRPGGNGVVGTMALKGAAPDGHTVGILSVTNGALNTYLVRNLGYDPIRDFTPIGFLAEAPYVLVVNPNNPARTTADLMEQARRRPGALTFSHGNASSLIGTELMNRTAGVSMLPVPVRGGPDALTEVMAGRIDCTLTDLVAGLTQVRDGRVRALGVTSREPTPLAPDIPPIARDVPGFELIVWFGVSAPANTPAPVVSRFNAALEKVLGSAELRERLGRLGYAPRSMPPTEWQRFLQGQITDLTRLAREVGLEPS